MITSIKLLEANQILAQVLDSERGSEINVKKFCKLAACSRPTFYAHYGSMRQLSAELLLKKLDQHLYFATGDYGNGLKRLLTYMEKDHCFILNLLALIDAEKGKINGKEFAARFPQKVEWLLRKKTVCYVDAHSLSGDYSIKTLNNAAHIIYAILYEWLAEGLQLSARDVYDRCQLAIEIVEEQTSKKALL